MESKKKKITMGTVFYLPTIFKLFFVTHSPKIKVKQIVFHVIQ